MRDHLHAIGIMTGNSLDGADLVLTRFGRDDGAMLDLGAHSVPFPEDLKDDLRALRAAVNAAEGWVDRAVANLGPAAFDRTLGRYTALLAGAVADLRTLAGADVDLIGLHGQTCAHRPPSIAGTGKLADAYTVQLGDGPGLADRTGIAVVDDFRSDDLMAGGEGAPLAPLHHRHLAEVARARGRFPIAFCNGGNTGNVSVISVDSATGAPVTLGWDTGPFNHFPDRLMQLEAGRACDLDGAVGRRGTIDLGLLGLLFRAAVVTGDGGNFLLRPPPKSSDPEWYRLPPELLGHAPVAGRVLPLEDRVRTATYFAAYAFAHSLALIPAAIAPPAHFATCGGGWRNPLCPGDFRALLAGDRDSPRSSPSTPTTSPASPPDPPARSSSRPPPSGSTPPRWRPGSSPTPPSPGSREIPSPSPPPPAPPARPSAASSASPAPTLPAPPGLSAPGSTTSRLLSPPRQIHTTPAGAEPPPGGAIASP